MTARAKVDIVREFLRMVPEHTSACDEAWRVNPGGYTTGTGDRGCTRDCGALRLKKVQAERALNELQWMHAT